MSKTLSGKAANGITLVSCIIICGVFLLYAFIQKGLAERSQQVAIENMKLAEVQEQIAKKKSLEAKRMEQELKRAKQRIYEKDSIIALLKSKRK